MKTKDILISWALAMFLLIPGVTNSHYRFGIVSVFFTLNILLSLTLAKKTNWVSGIASFYFGTVCIILIAFSKDLLKIKGFPEDFLLNSVHLSQLVSDSYVTFLLIITGLLFLSTRWLGIVGTALALCGVFGSIYMILNWAHGKPAMFLFQNPAIDSAFVAVTMPGAYSVFRRSFPKASLLIWVLGITACFVSKSSTGVMGAGLAVGVNCLASRRFELEAWVDCFAIGLLAAIIGWYVQGPVLFDSSGRFDMWQLTFSHFKEFNPFFGAGPGTHFLRGPLFQLAQNPNAEHIEGFLWLHNDWLQVLFELGAIGFCLVAGVYAMALKGARETPALFSCLVTLGAISLTQFPLRLPLFSLLAGVLVYAATVKLDELS